MNQQGRDVRFVPVADIAWSWRRRCRRCEIGINRAGPTTASRV